MIGETISHYRIIKRLGSGGMGEVYQAEDTRLRRPVALKMMLDDGGHNAQARMRFLREAQASSALNHPNIVTIYEIDEVERDGARYSFIVMEYVEGRTLKEVAGECSIEEAVDIVMQIADALAQAHERGIVHRDIKPSNVIVTPQNRVKVLDFGVAKFELAPLEDGETASLFSTEFVKTMPGAVIGTFAYMSPEQALAKDVDHRSDVFSLGVVAYELVAGQPAFTGNSSLAVVDAILHSDPPPMARFNLQTPPELEAIVRRMLEKTPELRYQSLRDVHADLDALKRESLTQLLPGPSYETNAGYSTQVLSSRSGGSGAARSGSGGFGARQFSPRAEKSVAVLRFNNVTKSPEDDWLGVGIAETVTADLKNVDGMTVIGRELIYEALRRWNAENHTDFDEKFATRVGREVGARWIIGGGYQRIGEMLRITARFVEVATGEVLKTVKIDGRMSEVFDLQDKIVHDLSRNLDLDSGKLKGAAQRETEVIEAYEACTRARMELYSGSREGLDGAVQLLEKAIALDPNYAQAYAFMGYAFSLKAQFLSMPALLDRAVEYLQKAIELRPMLSDSYSALGMTFIAMNRVDDAIGALKRAIAIAPHDSFVHAALGRAYYIGKGLFREAAYEYEQALDDAQEGNWVAPALSHCLTYLGEYERAEQMARRAIEAQEHYLRGHEGIQIIGAYARLGHVYYLQGRYDDAIAEYYREVVFARQSDHVLKERTLIEVYQKLTSAYARQGSLDDAGEAFSHVTAGFAERLAKGADDPFTRYYVACAHAMVGDKASALEHLRKAIEGRRNFNAARARVEIDFESLRDDPEFRELVKA
ncbi:MAG TPA: protein kinase [Blastocatellia bacterium]|jgi:non-specific serine/threonine protein kinase|nr:protein kinase [Blastocatellia bacterium]